MFSKSVPDICGWINIAGKYTTHPTLSGYQTTDWAIIGGGITGLSAARRIAELDPTARILLIDGKQIGQGASGRNSGFVVANESPKKDILLTPREHADYTTINALDHAGVSELKALIKHHNIECQWEDTGSIHAAASPENFDTLRHHEQAFSDMGIDATILDAEDLKKRLGTDHYKLGILSKGGAMVQPASLIKGLVNSMPEQVEIFENSPVLNIHEGGDGTTLTLATGNVRTKRVIVAVNAFMPRLGLKRDRVFPLALTASLTRQLTEAEEDAISHVPSWGVLAPHSFGATVRLTKDRRILIRNTAEYKPSGIGPRTLALRRERHYTSLTKRFPWLADDAIDYTWSGNICISKNSKPVFERLSDNIFAVGCYNASGLSKGSIMGKLIVDLAYGEPSDLLDKALSLTKPNWIPPRPFFDVGVKARMAFSRMKGLSEN